MVLANKAIVNFVGGEVSARLSGRTDLPLYGKVLSHMENFIAEPQGPARYRPGTVLVNHTRQNKKAVFIPFQFNDIQSYLIEATDSFFRFYKQGGVILETTKAITGITKANPGVVTSVAHGYTNGQELYLSAINGMKQLNGRFVTVAGAAANTYQLHDEFGNNVNTTNFGTYTSGGTSARIYEVATPYVEADLERIKYTQNADTMYLSHRGYDVRKLTRSGETNWTLATYVRTTDPWVGAGNWPGAVSFTSDARLQGAGTTNRPETFNFSRGPTTAGAIQFDVFTGGTNATDAVSFTLAPLHGKVDSVRWLANTDKFIVAGTFGSVRILYGASEDQSITPSAITAKSINAYGTSYADPIVNGSTLFYIQRGGLRLQSIGYDYTVAGYTSTDRNLVADHLGLPGMNQIVNQIGNPDIIWAVRNDGVLLGLTYKDKENISGWHHHSIAGGQVEWAGVLPRENNQEQLWLIVKRTINGNTVRHVEYVSDPPSFPDSVDFYSGQGNEVADMTRFYNAQWEQSKWAIHLDAVATYDGSAYGLAAGATLTVGAGGDDDDEIGVVLTASAAVFTSDMVGRQIWGEYDGTGIGGGRAQITAVTDSTHVVVEMLSAFPTGAVFAAGNWFITATTLSNLNHLEGKTVGLITDGAVPDDVVVTNGTITISEPASVIHVGLRYTGIMKTLPLDQGGVTGPAQSKEKIVRKVAMRFVNSAGVSYGTSLYKLTTIEFRRTSDVTGRPIPLFTGVDDEFYEDGWEVNKSVVIIQDKPLPCMIASLDIYTDTSDE